MKGQGKRKKSKSSRNPANDIAVFDKWVIKELHGTRREAPAALAQPPLRGTLLAPGATSSALGHPPQQQGQMQMVLLQRQQRLLLLSLLAFTRSHRLDRGVWLLSAHGWSFPQKSAFLLGEGSPQSQDYSSECYIPLPPGAQQAGQEPQNENSFCLQPGLSPLPHQRGMQIHKHSIPNLQPLFPMTLAVTSAAPTGFSMPSQALFAQTMQTPTP